MNSSDSHILRGFNSDGTIVDYYGQRAANGLVSSLSAIQVTPSGGGTTSYLLDQTGRPVRIASPNGVVFTLAWQTATSLILTATDPGALAEVSVPISEGIAQPATAKLLKPAAAVAAAEAQPSNGNSGSVVTCGQCGNRMDAADVSLSILSHTRGPLPPVPGIPLGNGMFLMPIPLYQPNAVSNAITQLQGACHAIADVLGDVCEASEPLESLEPFLPGLVGTAVALIPGGIPLVPLFVTATAAMIEGLDEYCKHSCARASRR